MFKCEFCNKEFFFNGQLQSHIEYNHKKDIVEEQDYQQELASINALLRAQEALDRAEERDSIDANRYIIRTRQPNIYVQWIAAAQENERNNIERVYPTMPELSSFGFTAVPPEAPLW